MITARRRKGAYVGSLYPFADLAVGEEFTALRNMGLTSNARCKRKKSIAGAAAQFAKRHGGTFEVRVRDKQTVYCRRTS